jgi:AcrR family transcriptional regulator
MLLVYGVDYGVNVTLHRRLVKVTIEASPRTEGRLPLSKERVLLAAVELADRGGIEALSMRKLGQELGVDAMALYRHVRNKDDLLDGIVEVIIGEIDRPPTSSDWKGALREQAMAARRVMLHHPWARRVLEERPKGGPTFLAYVESVLATLRAGGFSIDLAHHTLHVLGSRIFGFNQDLLEDKAQSVPSPEEAAILMRALAPFPRVSEMAQSVSHDGVLGACDDEVEFAFGLDLILDGLERQIQRAPID